MKSNLKKPTRNIHQRQQKFYEKSQPSQQQQTPDSQKYELTQNQNRIIQDIKMITFIDHLYSKYKLLNKLSQDQSNKFQTQVIEMLIDQNENVDAQLYKQTVQRIGLQTFILQVLGTVIQKRNKFKNQYQMSRNIEQITKQLQKQQHQVIRRKKELDKKQILLRKRQEVILQSIKQKVIEMQQKSKVSLLAIQNQIRKRGNALITTLKCRQKQITDKMLAMKQARIKIREFQAQQRTLEEKIKLLDRKEKERKAKQAASQQTTKKMVDLKVKTTQFEQANRKLDEQLKRLNKKIKTNQMAYKHHKDETQKNHGKYTEIRQELNKISGLNQKLKDQLFQETTSKERLLKQVQNLKTSLLRTQNWAAQLQEQKEVLSLKIEENKPINNPLINFEQLDISKICEQSLRKQQHQFMTDRETDQSILQYAAQPILLLEQKYQIKQISKTIDVKQTIRFSPKEISKLSCSQQQSQDSESQRQYFMKNQSNNKLFNKMKIHKQKKQVNQRKCSNSKARSRLKQLKQQNQQMKSQQQSCKQENIKLFDNYFEEVNQSSTQNNIHYEYDYDSDSSQLMGMKNTKSQDRSRATNKTPVIKNSHDQILGQLKELISPSEEQYCLVVQSLTLQVITKWIGTISRQLKYARDLVQLFLEIVLRAIQPCSCPSHQKLRRLLFFKQIVSFLQQTFLKYQAIVPEIQEKAIIILSRILLSYQNQDEKTQEFVLKDKFLKSLKVKLLVQKDQFIRSNVKFLMEYQ